jgi:hypothetical protein
MPFKCQPGRTSEKRNPARQVRSADSGVHLPRTRVSPPQSQGQSGKPDSERGIGLCPLMASKDFFGPMKEMFRRDAWKVVLIAILTVIGLLTIRACLQQ